jgi:hypothetical protein
MRLLVFSPHTVGELVRFAPRAGLIDEQELASAVLF